MGGVLDWGMINLCGDNGTGVRLGSPPPCKSGNAENPRSTRVFVVCGACCNLSLFPSLVRYTYITVNQMGCTAEAPKAIFCKDNFIADTVANLYTDWVECLAWKYTPLLSG